MQHPTGRRALALVAALTLGAAGSAFAQDTTEVGGARFDTTEAPTGALDTATADTTGQMDRDTSAANDTTDASGVQNPPGYRGMERDTTMFPPEGGPPASPEDAAGQTTGRYGDSASSDTGAAEQNPPGYRGMERPVGGDSAAAAGDTTGQAVDSAQ